MLREDRGVIKKSTSLHLNIWFLNTYAQWLYLSLRVLTVSSEVLAQEFNLLGGRAELTMYFLPPGKTLNSVASEGFSSTTSAVVERFYLSQLCSLDESALDTLSNKNVVSAPFFFFFFKRLTQSHSTVGNMLIALERLLRSVLIIYVGMKLRPEGRLKTMLT